MVTANRTFVANFTQVYYTVSFTVTVEGVPLAGAVITIDPAKYEIVTDANGAAQIDLPNGTYYFTLVAEGYSSTAGEFTVAGENLSIPILVPSNVDTNMLASLNVYPNPFKGSITLNNASGVRRVVFTNLIGQKVKELELTGVERATISTDDLLSGVYLIIFQGNNGERVIKKMIKE
jgi:hypothetical protein